MLDAPVPGERGPGGPGTQPHHKRPIGRERRLVLGHKGPPTPPRRGGACARCPWHARSVQYVAVQDYGPSVQIGSRGATGAFKFCLSCAGGKALWTRSTLSPLGLFVWRRRGPLVAGRPQDSLAATVPGHAGLSGGASRPPGDESRGAAARRGGTHVTDTVLRVSVREIRAALGDAAAAPQYLETVGRQGYRWLVGGNLEGPPPQTAGPLVGRQGDVAALEGWYQQAAHGARQLVFVSGEAGVGKTTVVEMLLTRLATMRERWTARGKCVEHYRGGRAEPALLRGVGAAGAWA